MIPLPLLRTCSVACLLAIISTGPLLGQAVAPATEPPSRPAPPVTVPVERVPQSDIVQLSPFEVSSERDMGYYATHTLSGTRLNTRLRDLGASITVVTPQQLMDTASVDINDVFQYEANTEGTHTYTEYGLDRGSISTTSVQMSPQQANRLRGIGRPDTAVDYFISLSQIPADSYNVERLTINRGPNAILYGLGGAAGLVNTSLAQARVGGNTRYVELRAGSWDDYRASFNINQTLVDNRFAVRVAGLYHERGYMRKPSHDYTRRGYVAATYQPFERTRIRASMEKFNNNFRRPNVNTPQDFISNWLAAGQPTFNPSTMMVRRGDGSLAPIGTAAPAQFDAVINELSNGGLGIHPHNTRAAFLIEDNQVFTRIQRQLGTTIGGTQLIEQVAATALPLPSAIFTPPGISDRSLYDWESINVLSGNYGKDNADMYQINVEQQLAQDLFLELAWRREKLERFGLSAQSGSQAGIYVDVNETLLDGTPNPFFRKPYIEVWEPTANTNFTDNEAARATLAYEFNFNRFNNRWLNLLGRHNLMGLGERREIDYHGFRWREAVISTHEGWAPERNPNGTIINKSEGSNFRTRHNRVYYLGDNIAITKAPGDALFGAIPEAGADYPEGVIGQPFPHTLRHFVPINSGARVAAPDYGVPGGRPQGEWVNENAISAVILHDTAPAMEETRIKSWAGVWQSYWWEDRIVGTLGWRRDTRKFRRSTNPIINEQGFRDNVRESLRTFNSDWDEVSGNTSTKGVVIHPLQGWNRVPAWAQGFSFHYNESDTFQPAPTETDLFLRVLPIPAGTGKDYGFTYATPDDRFVLRMNWYESAQQFSRAGAGLVTGRARRVENEGTWGFVDMIEADIERREGLPENTLDAFSTNSPVTAPFLSEIADRAGLTTEFLQYTGGYNDTQTATSKGMEISLDYNPTRYWNVKLTAGRQEAINSAVAPGAQSWLFGDGSFENPAPGSRLDLWTKAQFFDPRDGQTKPWWTTNWPGMPSWGQTPQAWYTGVVESLLRQQIRLQGLSNPQVRKWRASLITNYRFTDGLLRNTTVGGSLRWEDKAAIGYMGAINPASGIMELYDVDRPIWDQARTYVDLWTSYSTNIWNDKVRLRLQLNVRNAFESVGLQVFAANPDGSPAGFRIRDGRTWYLTAGFEF
jgi:outer membrane receptor protein involved in Fe transport